MKLNHEFERVFKGLLQPREIHHKFLTRILLNAQTFPFEDAHHHRITKKIKKNKKHRQETEHTVGQGKSGKSTVVTFRIAAKAVFSEKVS